MCGGVCESVGIPGEVRVDSICEQFWNVWYWDSQ